MKRALKDSFIVILLGSITLYILAFGLAFVEGLSDAQWNHPYSTCKKPISVIEHYTGLGKAIELGCALGKPYKQIEAIKKQGPPYDICDLDPEDDVCKFID